MLATAERACRENELVTSIIQQINVRVIQPKVFFGQVRHILQQFIQVKHGGGSSTDFGNRFQLGSACVDLLFDLLTFRDVTTDGNVLDWFTLFVQDRHHRRVHPVEMTVFGILKTDIAETGKDDHTAFINTYFKH